LDEANGFSVEYHNWYKIVTNHRVNEQYALVCCGQPTTNFTQYQAAVNTPVTSVGVTTVRDVLPYMELLGLSDRVQSIEGYQNVTSPCYGDVTDTPGNGTVDIVFTDHSISNMPDTHYIGFSPDNEELTPLQEMKPCINMLILCVEPIICSKLVEPNTAQSTVYTQINEFHTAIRYADFAIDVTPLSNLGNQSYEDWLSLGGFTTDLDIYSEAFIDDKNVFRTDGLVNSNGYSDWSQRSPARPDLALRDIIHMMYPTYQANYSSTWLRNFAKQDRPRQIADISYACDATDIISELQCAPEKFGVNQRQDSGDGGHAHTLSAGGKAGISVGVIVAAVLAGLAAFFLWRRHRQVKASRTFYRMNDVNHSNP
ncbi:hypothetical protein BDB00DRAFT_770406, partial [Zychaea mexicana]|uniref:uncharacterized protein n=1 Tax=Zychaea mexicana TaxID=64656 RepID=UPI0022FED133